MREAFGAIEELQHGVIDEASIFSFSAAFARSYLSSISPMEALSGDTFYQDATVRVLERIAAEADEKLQEK